MRKFSNVADRMLSWIQKFRYGELGFSVVIGSGAFTVFWTILEAAGVPGSVVTILAIAYASTLLGFVVLLYLINRRHEREIRLNTSLSRYQQGTSGSEPKPIGIVAPLSSWSTNYYVAIIKAIREAAAREERKNRRQIVVLDVPGDQILDVDDVFSEVIIRDLSGLVLINMCLDSRIRKALIDTQIPVVSVTHHDSKPPVVCSILPDHIGFKVLIEHALLPTRSQAAVFVTKDLSNPMKRLKVDTFRKEKRDIYKAVSRKASLINERTIHISKLDQKIRLQPGDSYIIEVDQYLPEYGYKIFEQLADPIPLGSAFIFLADQVAIGFLVASRHHYGSNTINKRLVVTGFDNTMESEWFDLSTVDYQLNIVGRLAYERIQVALDYPRHFAYTEEVVNTVPIFRGSSNIELR